MSGREAHTLSSNQLTRTAAGAGSCGSLFLITATCNFSTSKELIQFVCNGSPQVQKKASPEEEDDGRSGLSVHVSLLQPREVMRRQNGEEQKYWDNILHGLLGGVPDPHYLSVRAS